MKFFTNSSQIILCNEFGIYDDESCSSPKLRFPLVPAEAPPSCIEHFPYELSRCQCDVDRFFLFGSDKQIRGMLINTFSLNVFITRFLRITSPNSDLASLLMHMAMVIKWIKCSVKTTLLSSWIMVYFYSST